MVRYGLLSLLFGLLLACGCEPRRETQPSLLAEEDCEYVVAVLVDLSDSFRERMTEGGQAYDFLLSLLDRYFRDRIGTHDQLILAQISGTSERALLWQGTPLELRKDFPNAQEFSQFLRSKADPQGSHVHTALAQTVAYLQNQPSVANGKARSALFAFSDMQDNESNRAESRDQAVQALLEYGKIGGTVGLFYVDQTLVPVWQRELEKTGLKFRVEPEIRRPSLPSFE